METRRTAVLVSLTDTSKFVIPIYTFIILYLAVFCAESELIERFIVVSLCCFFGFLLIFIAYYTSYCKAHKTRKTSSYGTELLKDAK